MHMLTTEMMTKCFQEGEQFFELETKTFLSGKGVRTYLWVFSIGFLNLVEFECILQESHKIHLLTCRHMKVKMPHFRRVNWQLLIAIC